MAGLALPMLVLMASQAQAFVPLSAGALGARGLSSECCGLQYGKRAGVHTASGPGGCLAAENGRPLGLSAEWTGSPGAWGGEAGFGGLRLGVSAFLGASEALGPMRLSSQLHPSGSRRAAQSSGLLTLYAQRGRGGRGRGGRGRGRGRGRGMPFQRQTNTVPMNDELDFPEMRVVVSNPDGKDDMLGVMTRAEALAAAEERGQDLIVVSPEANPPVCKIINYDKLRYENEKKEKMKKKNSKNAELKEVKLSYKIDVHDYDVRKRATMKFLTKGDKVKASIRFKGREMAHQKRAQETLIQLMNDCEELATAERKPSMEGRIMMMILAPNAETLKNAEKIRKDNTKGKGKKGKKNKALAGLDLDDDEEEDEDEIAAQQELSDDEDDEDEVESFIDYELDELSEEEMNKKITEVGNRIRTLKEEGIPKDKIAIHVDELLALKSRYQEVTGNAWEPAVAK